MKKFILPILLLCVLSVAVQAQITVTETQKPMSQGLNAGINLSIADVDAKFVEKAWMKFAKDFKGKTKKIRKTGEIFTDNAEMSAISSNEFDVYATVATNGNNVIVTSWYDLGGAYVSMSSHAAEFAILEKQLKAFGIETKQAFIEDLLKKEEKEFSKREKELAKLVATNTGLHNDIENYKLKITEAEQGIQQNIAGQANTQNEIAAQKAKIATIERRLSVVEQERDGNAVKVEKVEPAIKVEKIKEVKKIEAPAAEEVKEKVEEIKEEKEEQTEEMVAKAAPAPEMKEIGEEVEITEVVELVDAPDLSNTVETAEEKVEEVMEEATIETLDESSAAEGAVVLYTKDGCDRCEMAKTFLKKQGVEFTEKNISTDAAAKKEMFVNLAMNGYEGGKVQTPVIAVGDKMHYNIEDLVGFLMEMKK